MSYVYVQFNSSERPLDIFYSKLCKFKLNTIQYDSIHQLCSECYNDKAYVLGNIVWPDNIEHLKEHDLYPDKFFVDIIMNTHLNNGIPINPPFITNEESLKNIKYYSLNQNQLNIIDAIMKNGSINNYDLCAEKKDKCDTDNRYIYSEHSGGIKIMKNDELTITIDTKTDRIDKNDPTIFLPRKQKYLKNYEFVFHTHPNTTTYAGRLNDYVLYEFPSSNDLFNYTYYFNKGKCQASLIAAPEGMYVIRQIVLKNSISLDPELFYYIRKRITKLEMEAIKNIKDIEMIAEPEKFHKDVSQNRNYINRYNELIKNNNLYIEYYPKIKVNNEWIYSDLNLQYIKK
jgi:hypothetical protein